MDLNRNYSIKDISLIINSNIGMNYSVLSHTFRIRTFLLYLVHISKMLKVFSGYFSDLPVDLFGKSPKIS